MVKERYIGIENELISFRNNKVVPFNKTSFKKIGRHTKYKMVDGYDDIMWSDVGGLYYVDGSELELATPPVALNKGFSTRLTDLLIRARNQVVKNTPHMKHTGYSMHWNLTTPSSVTLDSYDISFYQDIAIPFQLFGLTPMSCGFNVKIKSDNHRFEIAGDSLTNTNQINATALLLGAYNLAKTNHDFPIKISNVNNKIQHLSNITANMLPNGRYTKLYLERKTILRHDNNIQIIPAQETQAQNILELFYDWISPFVYKLGERDEINNLEAFITGEKKLEMDNVKYFYMLDNKIQKFSEKFGCKGYFGVYRPVYVKTNNSKSSQILKLVNQNTSNIPLEGKLWQKSINMNLPIYKSPDWEKLEIGNSTYDDNYQVAYGIDDIYKLLSQISKIDYVNSLNYTNINPNLIFTDNYMIKINKKILYNPNQDNSAIIEDPVIFEKYLHNKKYLNEIEVK
jgi:hypothetical protein